MAAVHIGIGHDDDAAVAQPFEVEMSALISLLERILSRRARSVFMILPRNGKIAWKWRSRPCLAEPPAESPSTIYSSVLEESRSEQSASLPGSVNDSSADLRITRSRALRAASRARADVRHLAMMALAACGFSSRKVVYASPTICCT